MIILLFLFYVYCFGVFVLYRYVALKKKMKAKLIEYGWVSGERINIVVRKSIDLDSMLTIKNYPPLGSLAQNHATHNQPTEE